MNYEKGRTLSEMIRTESGPIPWDRARPMFEELLEAVGYAHKHGVVHKDLNSKKVLVSPEGQVKILGFGEPPFELGDPKESIGTFSNRPHPLQCQDQRADIYALGMTLYEMLAGRPLWENGSYPTVMENADFPPPTAFYPYIPNHVVRALQRATAIDPQNLWTDVEDFASALFLHD